MTAVNPDTQIVYHMDPLKRRIASEEWTEVVDKLVPHKKYISFGMTSIFIKKSVLNLIYVILP